MAIVKTIIASTDLGNTLQVDGSNKVQVNIDGTSIVADGSGVLSTAVAPSVINDLVTLSGVAANSTNLATFSGTIIPDNQTVKQAIQALETAFEALNISGEYVGSSTTVAGFPTTDLGGQPLLNGNWAILSADDAANQAGIWVYDGTTWNLGKEIPEVFNLVVSTANTNSITLSGDGNATALSADLVVDATVIGNLVTVAANGVSVNPATIKGFFDFDIELQDLSGTVIGYCHPSELVP